MSGKKRLRSSRYSSDAPSKRGEEKLRVDKSQLDELVRQRKAKCKSEAAEQVEAYLRSREWSKYTASVLCPGSVSTDIVTLVVFTGDRFLPRKDLAITSEHDSAQGTLLPAGCDPETRAHYEAAGVLFQIIAGDAPAQLTLDELQQLSRATQYFGADYVVECLPAYLAPLQSQLDADDACELLHSLMVCLAEASPSSYARLLSTLGWCLCNDDVSIEGFEAAAREFVLWSRTLAGPPAAVLDTGRAGHSPLVRVLGAAIAPTGPRMTPALALSCVLLAAAICGLCDSPGITPTRSRRTVVPEEEDEPTPAAEVALGEHKVCASIADLMRRCMSRASAVLRLQGTQEAAIKAQLAVQLLASARDVLRDGRCACFDAACDAFTVVNAGDAASWYLVESAFAATGHIISLRDINVVTWSSDGRRLLVSGDHIIIFDAETGECEQLLGQKGPVSAAAFSPDAASLACGCTTGIVQCWSVAERCKLTGSYEGHTEGVEHLAWSHDGQHVATACADATVRLWHHPTKQCVHVCTGHADEAQKVAWSLDDTRVASASRDGTVRVWDAETGHCLHVLQVYSSSFAMSEWSPTGNLLATGSLFAESAGGVLRIFGLKSGDLVGSHELARDCGIGVCAWSPNGAQLAYACYDGKVRIWDVKQEQCVLVLEVDYDDDDEDFNTSVQDISWSPDGYHLASVEEDGVVRVWHVPSATTRLTLLGQGEYRVYRNMVAWSPDGARIAVGSGRDGDRVHVWTLGCAVMREAANASCRGQPISVTLTVVEQQ